MSIIKKRTIYIAHLSAVEETLVGNTIRIYDTPYKLKVTLNSINGYTDSVAYGDHINNMVKALLDIKYLNTIGEGDKAYLYGVVPDGEDTNGANANYIVDAVRPHNTKMSVYFKRLV